MRGCAAEVELAPLGLVGNSPWNDFHVGQPIRADVRAKTLDRSWIGLERENLPACPNEPCGVQRVVADVGPDVDDGHSRPDRLLEELDLERLQRAGGDLSQ